MQDMTNEEFVARLGDHPAEMAMREYMRLIQPRNPNMLRSLSGGERKALWDHVEAHTKSNGHIESYLELGVNCGVSMWIMAQLVKPGGMIVGVDMLSDRADPKVQARTKAAACIYDLRKIPCAMIEQNTRDAVGSVKYAFAPFDALLIDGDHTYEGALLDWIDYMPMVRRGGLVIMHDIENTAFGCSKVWHDHKSELSSWVECGNLGIGAK